MKRREFNKNAVLGLFGATALTSGCESAFLPDPGPRIKVNTPPVSTDLSERMYTKALELTKAKVRGGVSEPFFKKPFVDAAFSDNIFLWDTCFIVCFAKYHLDTLPVYQALNNFYDRMDPDGFICREYRSDGRPLWSKDHPVSINPPLLAFADDPDYKGWGDYWLGGVWPPTTYMVLKGLTAYGKHELAYDLAVKTYTAVAAVFEANGTFWENYVPDLIAYGMPSKKDFCGWTGLVPVAIYREYLAETQDS
ncbi:MGH1-like glycoside hydrolase domain-containing protein [Robertkochia sediminum]|uniref:MGH1-like glycoside hydrolase domain-containing protein n=1 Tax=Robertkochia sediminum TaxID=2785326 RepID=UPI0019321E11|nr:trehalase family glycosidase [Robertkochia sediminum]MBL7472019.1 hypothetical protein [Robertkochia sediminum]